MSCKFGALLLCSSVSAEAGSDALSLLQTAARARLQSDPSPQDNIAQAKASWELMNAESAAAVSHSVADQEMENGNADSAFCTYMKLAVQERKQCANCKGVTVSEWPAECGNPDGIEIATDNQAGPDEEATTIVRMVGLTTAEAVQTAWDALPLSGILVLQNMTSQPAEARKIIWQSMHQLHSRLYMEGAPLTPNQIGLPRLSYLAFFGSRAVLQKSAENTKSQLYPDGAQSEIDVAHADGQFNQLAVKAGTDKIDGIHRYQMLYHRVLDTFPPNKGMMLEIGLGCTMNYGAGASAKIWPKLFPNMAVHFIELDKECTEKWLPNMKEIGVADVHVGSQADPTVLEGVITASQKYPGGLQLVIDDGSHQCQHIEASFRALFSQVRSGGLYVVEDMMYAGWGTPYGAETAKHYTEKYQQTQGTPMALSAVLATSAIGVAKEFEFPAKTWEENILSDFGPQVRAVECTPGVCGFRHV